MELVYLVCFFLGLGFAILSGLLAGVFTGGAESVGDLDFSGGSPDIDLGGSHVHAASFEGPHGAVTFPAISPVTISTFVASFGGTGILMNKLIVPPPPAYVHLPVSVVSGLVVATAVFYLFYKIFGKFQVSSAPRLEDITGHEATVDITVPKNGVGQISYVISDAHFTAPARAVDNEEIKSGSQVKIIKVIAGTYYVQRIK